MNESVSRRQFMLAVPGLSVAGSLLLGIPLEPAHAEEDAALRTELWPEFPRQDARQVLEVVGAAHFNEARVRELVDLRPALVNAWWDWGFGDWESPLGAAAHTGRRTIAEFLIERGARVDIFAAAMLGWTDVVRSFVAASPGIQRTKGPHSIPLLAHAEAGGDAATETLAYLAGLGDAGDVLPAQALSEQDKSTYVGKYQYGPAPADVLEVTLDKNKLSIAKLKEAKKPIHYQGDHAFIPSGVPDVRIRFDVQNGRAVSLSIIEREPLVTARRIGG